MENTRIEGKSSFLIRDLLDLDNNCDKIEDDSENFKNNEENAYYEDNYDRDENGKIS
jgi:hypothetical protein